MQKLFPLRRRLFLLAAVALLPVALMSGLGLWMLYDDQREQAERNALELTRALGTAVDAELKRSIAVLEALAGAPQLLQDDLVQFRDRSQRALASQPQWNNLIVTRPDGQQVMNLLLPEAHRVTIEPESFQDVLRTGRPVVGNLRRGQLGNWGVPVRVPVMREGQLVYILTAVVRPESFVDVIVRQGLPAGYAVTAMDRKGLRVARWPGQNEYVGTRVSPTLQDMMARSGREGSGPTTTSEGTPVLTAFSTTREHGWRVALGLPEAVVLAGARRSLYVYGSGIALSILAGLLAALVIARSINRPVSQLREAARAVGRGEIPTPAETHLRELHEVSQALTTSGEERARFEADREELLRREQAARAQAEAANRSKDEFLAMLGHELRNPLGAISNATMLLQHRELPEASRTSAMEIIARQVSHLSRLTDDLLDAGRALMGKIVLRRKPVNLAEAAAHALATMRSAGRTQHHHVVQELEPAWSEVDPIRLDQIIGNLVVNAAKYTPQGGIIRVRTFREGPDAVIQVADNGIGLTPELAARAFDLFVQGERDLDRAQGGLGIGLTLVRSLAQMHGGNATVHSDGPGTGSEFTVRIPAVEAPAVEDAPEERTASSRCRILLVEDNVDARDSMSALLGMWGHDVQVAGDGNAGLELALAIGPDVALLDIGLPGMDGYEVARRIRAQGGTQPYLIALTGYGLPEDRRRALDAGFDAHLVKPVDPSLLSTALAGVPRRAPLDGVAPADPLREA